MSVAEKKETEYFFISVAGDLNPAIHHPHWYESLGVLGRSAVDAALNDPGFLCSTELARFRAGPFTLVCESNRWTIGTRRRDQVEGILEITRAVWTALVHTPIYQFQFDIGDKRRTSLPDVPAALARLVLTTPLDLPQPSRSAEIRYQSGTEERDVHVNIGSAGHDEEWRSFVHVHVLASYPIRKEAGLRVDLAAMVQANFLRDMNQAIEQID